MKRELSIITYHYVRELVRSRYPGIKGRTVTEFEEQLRYLKEHYLLIGMDDLVAVLGGERELEENAALLTFDDGYLDHFVSAFPLLKKYEVPGAFFVPMEALYERRVLDVNKIHYVLASVSDDQMLVDVVFTELDALRGSVMLDSNEAYYARLAVPGRYDGPERVFVKKLLQVELDREIRNKIVDRLFDEFVGVSEQVLAEELYMTVDQIKLLAQAGMHIGNHTYSHQWLNAMSEEDQEQEIVRSLDHLNMLVGKRDSWSMCFPYGAYNDATLRLLEKHGCTVAFSTVGETTDLGAQNRLALSRLDTNQLAQEMSEVVAGVQA